MAKGGSYNDFKIKNYLGRNTLNGRNATNNGDFEENQKEL